MNGNQDVFDPMGTGKYRGESVSNVAPVDVQPIVVPETPQENVTESPKQTPLTFSVLEDAHALFRRRLAVSIWGN